MHPCIPFTNYRCTSYHRSVPLLAALQTARTAGRLQAPCAVGTAAYRGSVRLAPLTQYLSRCIRPQNYGPPERCPCRTNATGFPPQGPARLRLPNRRSGAVPLRNASVMCRRPRKTRAPVLSSAACGSQKHPRLSMASESTLAIAYTSYRRQGCSRRRAIHQPRQHLNPFKVAYEQEPTHHQQQG